MIRDSVEDAIKATVNQEGGAGTDDDEHVRLIWLYDNAQLRKAIALGEVCNSKLAMYLQVDPSCPLFYLPCYDGDDGRIEFEITHTPKILEWSNEGMSTMLEENDSFTKIVG